jgi:hypothetical protein
MTTSLLTVLFIVLAATPAANAISAHDSSERFLGQRVYGTHISSKLAQKSKDSHAIKMLAGPTGPEISPTDHYVKIEKRLFSEGKTQGTSLMIREIKEYRYRVHQWQLCNGLSQNISPLVSLRFCCKTCHIDSL